MFCKGTKLGNEKSHWFTEFHLLEDQLQKNLECATQLKLLQ